MSEAQTTGQATQRYLTMPAFMHLPGLPNDLEILLRPKENELVFRAKVDVSTNAWINDTDCSITRAYNTLAHMGFMDASIEFFPNPDIESPDLTKSRSNFDVVCSNRSNDDLAKKRREVPYFYYTKEICKDVAYDQLVVSLGNQGISIQNVLDKFDASTEKFGDIAVDMGYIRGHQLEAALKLQEQKPYMPDGYTPRRIGEVLQSQCLLDDIKVANVLARQYGLEVVPPNGQLIDYSMMHAVLYPSKNNDLVLPIKDGDSPLFLISDPTGPNIHTTAQILRKPTDRLRLAIAPTSLLADKLSEALEEYHQHLAGAD